MAKLSTGKKWHIITGALAITSAISFFQINSYWADKHHFNGVFGWLGIGIALGLGAIYSLYKTTENSN